MYKQFKQFAYLSDRLSFENRWGPVEEDGDLLVTDTKVIAEYRVRFHFEVQPPSRYFDWFFPNLHLLPESHEIEVNTPLALTLFGMGCRKVMDAPFQTFTVKEIRVFRKMAFFKLTKDNPISIVKWEPLYFSQYEESLPKQESPVVVSEVERSSVSTDKRGSVLGDSLKVKGEEFDNLIDDHLNKFCKEVEEKTIEKVETLLFLNSYDEDLNSGTEKFERILIQLAERKEEEQRELLLFLNSYDPDMNSGLEKFDSIVETRVQSSLVMNSYSCPFVNLEDRSLDLENKPIVLGVAGFEVEELGDQLEKSGHDACVVAESFNIESDCKLGPIRRSRFIGDMQADDHESLFIMNVMEARVSMQIEMDLLWLKREKIVSQVLKDRDKRKVLDLVHDIHHEIKTNRQMRMCEMVSFFFFFLKGKKLSRINRNHCQYRTITPIRDLAFVSGSVKCWGDFKWLLYLVQRSRSTLVYDPGRCTYPQIQVLESCNKVVEGRSRNDYCLNFAFSSHFVKTVGLACPKYYGNTMRAIKHFYFDKVRVVSVHSHYVYESDPCRPMGSLWRLVTGGAFDEVVRDHAASPFVATGRPIKLNIIKKLRVKDVD